MRINLKLSQQGMVLIGVPLVFEIAFVLILGLLCQQAQDEVARAAWARKVEIEKARLTRCTVDFSAGFFNYLWTQDHRWLQLCRKGISAVPERYRALEVVAAPDQSPARRQSAQAAVDRYVALMTQAVDLMDSGTNPDPSFSIEMKSAKVSFSSAIASLTKSASAIEESFPKRQKESRQRIFNVLTAGFVLNFLLAIAMAFYFIRSTSSRFNALLRNIGLLKSGLPLLPPMQTRDEIAELDRVLNRMADQVKEAARKEQAIIANSADVICAITDSGIFRSVSPAATRVWDRSAESLEGGSLDQVLSADEAKSALAHLDEIRNSGGSGEFENRVLRQDGSVAHMLWTAHWSGEEQLFSCVSHDISDRRQAEELLKASEARVTSMLEAMPIGLILLTDDGTMRMLNPTVVELFGRAEEWQDKPVSQLLGSAAVVDWRSFLTEVNERKAVEKEVVRKDGTKIAVELSVQALSINDAEHYLLILRDLSELYEIKRLKQSFVEMLTDDLRSPLASVQSYLGKLPADGSAYISERGLQKALSAQRSTSRMILLINDLVDMETLESGKFDLHCSPVALSSVIERSFDAVRAVAEKSDVRLECDPVEIQVVADGDRLVQVLVNLLGNAVKFSPAKGIVNVSARKMQGFVQVSVSDQGRGVPETHRQAIFERFRQVEVSDSRERKGTGLGLAICKAIVESHCGEIGVDGREGPGSVFWFRIPIESESGNGGNSDGAPPPSDGGQ